MKIFLLSVLFIVSIVSVNATEIAVIKLDEIVKNSAAMVKAEKEIKEKKEGIEKDLKKKEKVLQTEKEELEGQIKVLDQSVAQDKIQKFQEKVVKFQNEVKENEGSLQSAYVDVVTQITNNIKVIVSDLKKEKDGKYIFDVVLPSSFVVYNDGKLDISGEVITRLNKQYKTVKVNFKKK
ncbi:MAG: OmpH family outer membrane protein [Rickettsiales bacterium]|jgi:Skp family chaperone for outer membrane proteins|nr:OmpH family outer membrane protein [Rickettsiales bacterium]